LSVQLHKTNKQTNKKDAKSKQKANKQTKPEKKITELFMKPKHMEHKLFTFLYHRIVESRKDLKDQQVSTPCRRQGCQLLDQVLDQVLDLAQGPI